MSSLSIASRKSGLGSDELPGDAASRMDVMTKRLLWKLDTHILPPLALLWLANYVDRTNVGNAKIAGLERDTHLVKNQFNVALSVFYATYLASLLPSNWLIKKLGANCWLPFLVSAWGIVSTLTGLVQSFGGLIAIRLALGLCEGGLLPGMVLYLSTMYKRDELQLRIGIFYASASLSGAFGGLLATAIIKMDGVGGLAGWRWIFILEGIVTVFFGILAAFVLPAGLATAKFLTEEERLFAIHRFRSASAVANGVPIPDSVQTTHEEKDNSDKVGVGDVTSVYEEDEQFEWREIIRGLTEIQVWLTGFAYFGISVSIYSFSLFLPTIVSGLGYSGEQAQLHTVPPYVPALTLTLIVSFLADRLQWRGIFMLIFLPLTITGYIVAITAQNNHARYGAVFLMAAGLYPCNPCLLAILPNNTGGHYKKATAGALQLLISNTGGILSTFIYTPEQAPKYIKGHSIALAFVCLTWILIAANVSYCAWENKARREGRRIQNIAKWQQLWDEGKTRAPIGDRHPNFRFTL